MEASLDNPRLCAVVGDTNGWPEECSSPECAQLFRANFEQAAVGIAHLTIDGDWLRVNDRLCAIVGYEREVLLSRNFQQVTYPPDLEADLALARQLKAGEIPSYTIEKRYVRQDGALVWVNLTVSLARKADGVPEYAIAVVEDIQHRKQQEEALLDCQRRLAERTTALELANQELQESNHQLESFLFASSHDLRAPLSRIKNFSTLLERQYRDKLEGDGLLFLEFISQNSSRLIQLVEDLMNHSRINQERIDLKPINLEPQLRAVLRNKAVDIVEAGARVIVNLPTVDVLADAYALNQILDNLLQNALKYSDATRPMVIEVGGKVSQGRFCLWIRDNGIGFDMAYHDRIFEMFRRLHTCSEYEGSGVGLALVKRAMERMGGRVWAESVLGQGSIFYLEFLLADEATA